MPLGTLTVEDTFPFATWYLDIWEHYWLGFTAPH